MVTTELRDGADNLVNVWGITRGGARIGEDVVEGPLQAKVPQSVPRTKEMIRKATPLPTFDAHKQKEVMYECDRILKRDRSLKVCAHGKDYYRKEAMKQEESKYKSCFNVVCVDFYDV